jgi:hypothetical protein
MYKIVVEYVHASLSVEATVTGTDRADCIAQIEAVMETSTAHEYRIVSQGTI